MVLIESGRLVAVGIRHHRIAHKERHRHHPGIVHDLGKILFHRGTHGGMIGCLYVGAIKQTACNLDRYAVEVGDIFMPAVIAKLEMDIEEDKKAGCHADSEPGYIDQGENFVFEQVAEGDLEIVLQHIDVFGVENMGVWEPERCRICNYLMIIWLERHGRG